MKIAVYCGSVMGSNPEYRKAAEELGRWIAACGHTMVYGGGDAGIMGITAKNAFEGGASVIGVVPGNVDFIRNRPQPYVTELVVTEDMGSRKQKMLDLADAFIALPGGIGTLDEISEAITLTRIGVFKKKSVLFNREGFYDPLKAMFNEMLAAGFLGDTPIPHVLFSDDTETIGLWLNEK